MKQLFATLLLLLPQICDATHIRSGQIRVEQFEARGKTVRITVQITLNNGPVFGSENNVLDFGDGSTMSISAEHIIKEDNLATFIVFHNYPTAGAYTVTYTEPYRTEGIVNMDESVTTPFFLESFFRLDLDVAYESPQLLFQPFQHAFVSPTLRQSFAMRDKNDFALYYQLETPLRSHSQPVVNYRLPPSLQINPVNGLLTWDGKNSINSYAPGEYLFAVRIYQVYNNQVVGYMYRDVQIILTDDERTFHVDDNKSLNGHNRIFVEVGQNYKFKIFAYHSNEQTVTINASSELKKDEDYIIVTKDSLHEDQHIKVADITLTNTGDGVRDNPYILSVRCAFLSGDEEEFQDLNYTIFTKDVDFSGWPLILSSAETQSDISIYPNPVRDNLTISKLPDGENFIRVYGMSGLNVYGRKIHHDGVIDLSDLQRGIYIIDVVNRNGVILFKKKIAKQ